MDSVHVEAETKGQLGPQVTQQYQANKKNKTRKAVCFRIGPDIWR